MKLEQCKNLKVFFCGTVPLFAHFILCYRGMSLTIVDFLMCLELYIKSVTGDYCKLKANIVTVRPNKLFYLVLDNENSTNVLVGVPAVTALLQPIQLQHISLHSSLVSLLSFALCLFYSLHIITLLFILFANIG